MLEVTLFSDYPHGPLALGSSLRMHSISCAVGTRRADALVYYNDLCEDQEMRIGLDARFLLRKQRGMPIYVTQLCLRLPEIMQEDTFVLYINSGFEHNEAVSEYGDRLQTVQSACNVIVVDLKHEGEIYWEWSILPNELRKNPVDVLHMPGNRALLMTGAKQVVTFHDAMEWEDFSLFGALSLEKSFRANIRGILNRLHLGLNYFLGMKRADHILTVSEFSRNDLVAHFPSIYGRSSFVYHGLPPAFSRVSDTIAADRRKGILMLGGDSKQKNCENAVLAWSTLPKEIRTKHPLTILGFTGGEESVILRTLRRLGIESEVSLRGWVDDDIIVREFMRSRAFLFVSEVEGFGFPLVQSMACGTPAVISQAKVLVEIGGDSMPSAPYDRPDKIAERLHDLITSDTYWLSVQAAGLRRLSLFDWVKVTEHVKLLYREVAQGN